ncbi:MAG: hypothetical protein KKD85_13495 [Proteobacteria bacterium]|nr:hypothetical protein [Pseudomonadota bacterium]MBU4243341.1 hypothetical protein [Pseudomonadota bacterium]
MKVEIYLATLTQEFYASKPGTKWWPAVHSVVEEGATRWWPAVHAEVVRSETKWWPAVHAPVERAETKWWPAVHQVADERTWPSVYSSKPEKWKSATTGPVKSAHPLGRVIIREEEFGAIVFDPISQVVLKADADAAKAIAAIAAGEAPKDIFRSFKADEDVQKQFISVLRKVGLWDETK